MGVPGFKVKPLSLQSQQSFPLYPSLSAAHNYPALPLATFWLCSTREKQKQKDMIGALIFKKPELAR